MNTRISSLILAAALSFAMAAPAAAETRGDHYQARVSYTDLNLSSGSGADAFINRLRESARMTCGDRMGRMSLSEERRIRTCSRAFMQKGVIRAENATVSQRFLARGGRLPDVVVAS